MKPRDQASVERLCTAIRQASKVFENMRVGQLLVNARGHGPASDGTINSELYFIENDDLVSEINDYVRMKQEDKLKHLSVTVGDLTTKKDAG